MVKDNVLSIQNAVVKNNTLYTTGELKDAVQNDRLKRFLKEKGESHKTYKNYTCFPRLLKNLYEDKALYLSDGQTWNDRIDREYFLNQSEPGRKLYGMCFSYDTSESVAMWMLYGGLEDKGAMLNLSNNQIHHIINNCGSIDVGYFEKGIFQKTMTVNKGEYSLYLQDVLYYSKNDGTNTYLIMRNNEKFNTPYSKVEEEAKPTFKTIPWSYEKEVRLILDIPLPKADTKKTTFAKINIDESILKKIHRKIYCSPKYDLKLDKDGIAIPYIGRRKKIVQSKLYGQIEWDLKGSDAPIWAVIKENKEATEKYKKGLISKSELDAIRQKLISLL